jgi:hypothetical protein
MINQNSIFNNTLTDYVARLRLTSGSTLTRGV